jgi:hypothetical protein
MEYRLEISPPVQREVCFGVIASLQPHPSIPRFLRNGWDTYKILVYTISENALGHPEIMFLIL